MGTQPPWHSNICPSGCWVLCCSAPSPRRRKKRRWLGSVPESWRLSPWGVCIKDILQHRWRQDLIGGLCTAALHLRRRVFQLLWEVALKSKAFSFPFLQQKASSYRTCLQGCRYQRCWGNLPKNSTIRTLAASQSHKAAVWKETRQHCEALKTKDCCFLALERMYALWRSELKSVKQAEISRSARKCSWTEVESTVFLTTGFPF